MRLVAYCKIVKVKNADDQDVHVFTQREEFDAPQYQRTRREAVVAHAKSPSVLH